MKSYLKNLLIALLGRNPYQIELNKKVEEYELTARRVAKLEELRGVVEEKQAAAYRRTAELEKQVVGFQKLTEELRQHLADKDIELAALSKDFRTALEQAETESRGRMSALMEEYEEKVCGLKAAHQAELIDRHEEYEEKMAERDVKIAALREDLDATLERLQEANHAIARDLVARALLDKTNNGLEDLIAAMQSGDPEKILMATQYLDWSSHLVRIARAHLDVLRRKNELVERLHFTEVKTDDDDENVNHE